MHPVEGMQRTGLYVGRAQPGKRLCQVTDREDVQCAAERMLLHLTRAGGLDDCPVGVGPRHHTPTGPGARTSSMGESASQYKTESERLTGWSGSTSRHVSAKNRLVTRSRLGSLATVRFLVTMLRVIVNSAA